MGPWSSPRTPPVHFGVAAALPVPPPDSDLWLWAVGEGRWPVPAWGQISKENAPSQGAAAGAVQGAALGEQFQGGRGWRGGQPGLLGGGWVSRREGLSWTEQGSRVPSASWWCLRVGAALPCPPDPGGPLRGVRGLSPAAERAGLLLPAEACPEGRCTCLQSEFHCADPECQTCKHHPCPPGQGVKAYGNFTFGFKCVDCAAGTFSGGREGRCTPWADCSQPGLRTMFPGNKTHNAVCSPVPPPPAEPRCPLTAVLAVAACVLVLVVAQLGLHLWQLRRPRVWPPALHRDPAAPGGTAPQPPEDACSCQFPEEERGEQLSEDKGPLGTCE
ncbi:hypothetical protein QTO34_019189 [Cnephaeus nilssonii]|uniref:TNFR-Cys domain-containing protein n=1 Tax=Cnephaeus nilssonii TaxID=3371016 RepID=A0AA40LQT2_CNENI|nr:hypothetical protein QTO34_019189 [Eptesicus nilssonii]